MANGRGLQWDQRFLFETALTRPPGGHWHAGQGRRLLASATIYDGGSRGDAAQISSVDLQTVRDWVPY